MSDELTAMPPIDETQKAQETELSEKTEPRDLEVELGLIGRLFGA